MRGDGPVFVGKTSAHCRGAVRRFARPHAGCSPGSHRTHAVNALLALSTQLSPQKTCFHLKYFDSLLPYWTDLARVVCGCFNLSNHDKEVNISENKSHARNVPIFPLDGAHIQQLTLKCFHFENDCLTQMRVLLLA